MRITEDGIYQSLPIRNSQFSASQKSLSNYLVELPDQNLQLDLNVAESSLELSLPFNKNGDTATGLCGDCNNDQVSNELLKEDGQIISLEEFVDLWDFETTLEVHTGKEGNVNDNFGLELLFLVLPDIPYQPKTTGSAEQLPMIVPNPYLHLKPQSSGWPHREKVTTGNISPTRYQPRTTTGHHDGIHVGPTKSPAGLAPVSKESTSLEEEYSTEEPAPLPLTCPPHYVAMCEAIRNILAGCHLLHDPAPYVNSCKAQICSGALTQSEAEEAACSQTEDYAEVCRGEEICEDWREGGAHQFCPAPPCPAHSHYSDCGPGCERTCHSDLSCHGRHQPGCYCLPGYVMLEGRCQLEQEVCLSHTCSHNNTVRLNHQTWRPDPCTNCSCQGTSQISSRPLNSILSSE